MVIEFAGAIQDLATEKIGYLLKATMDFKREKAACLEVSTSEVVTSEAAESRGNSSSHTISDNVIDLNSTSTSHSLDNLDDIPVNKVYKTLQKTFAPSSSNQTTKKHVDEVYEPMYPSVLERIGHLSQSRIDVCQKLPVCHWLQPPYIQPLQTVSADEQFGDEPAEPASDNLNTTSSQPQPSYQPNDSSVLDELSNHYKGELPSLDPNSEKASETDLNSTVSESQQQPGSQMDEYM